MRKLPKLTGKKLISVLEKAGFVVIRVIIFCAIPMVEPQSFPFTREKPLGRG
jgi:hypothetical protein